MRLPAQPNEKRRQKQGAATQRQLERVAERLADEFPELSAEQVARDVRFHAAELLRDARVTEYVPLLVYRLLRELLLIERHAKIAEAA